MTSCQTCHSPEPRERKLVTAPRKYGQGYKYIEPSVMCTNDSFHRCGTCGSTEPGKRQTLLFGNEWAEGAVECTDSRFHGKGSLG